MAAVGLTVVALCILQVTAAKQIDRQALDARFPVVDYSSPDVPVLQVGGRVMDILNGEHFDDILVDSPDDVRPPGIIAFHGYKTCPQGLEDINFQEIAETKLPARERLWITSYDVDAAPYRAWYKFTPERDLAARFGVDLSEGCPQLVFVPRSCNGWTEWCREGNKLGCANFTEQCTNTVKYTGSLKHGAWIPWLKEKIAAEGVPKLSKGFASYNKQGRWIRARDSVSTTNVQRNNLMAKKLPAFTPTGAKTVPCPKELCDWLEEFYEERVNRKKQTEHWASSGTQNSFHVTKTHLYSIDEEYNNKMYLANKYMKPMMEEWSGIPNLELTSFYGIREYNEGHWLRNHVDREETHVISATISIAKFPVGTGLKNSTGPEANDPWPLEGVNWQGENIVYPHAPRTIILYESAKFIHGRYKTNPMQDGGIHLGAFLHYAPSDGTGWKNIAQQSSRHYERNADNIPFKQTDSEEFDNPVYSKHDYLAHTDNDIDDVIGNENGDAAAKSVRFENHSDRPLFLFWQGKDQVVDQCGEIHQGGAPCTINTFNSHQFFWATDEVGHHTVGNHLEISDEHEDGKAIRFDHKVDHEEL